MLTRNKFTLKFAFYIRHFICIALNGQGKFSLDTIMVKNYEYFKDF